MGWLKSIAKVIELGPKLLGIKELQPISELSRKQEDAKRRNAEAQAAAQRAAAEAKAQADQTAAMEAQQRQALANLQQNAASLQAANQETNALGDITNVVAGGSSAEQLKRRKGLSIAGLSSSLGVNS